MPTCMQPHTVHQTMSAMHWIRLASCRISSDPVMQATMWQMHAMYSSTWSRSRGQRHHHSLGCGAMGGHRQSTSQLLSTLSGCWGPLCLALTIMVPMMQLSHLVVWMRSSSWIMKRVEATLCAKQKQTCTEHVSGECGGNNEGCPDGNSGMIQVFNTCKLDLPPCTGSILGSSSLRSGLQSRQHHT